MTNRTRFRNSVYKTGFGYVIIPRDVDRTDYIEGCLRRERISIHLDDGGGILKECYVSKHVLSYIKFPEKSGELGSCVTFITPELNFLPIIVGVISRPDETSLYEENSFQKRVNSKTASVDIVGRGKTGELLVSVSSDYDDEGNIFIKLKSNKSSSILRVDCQGDMEINLDKGYSLKTYEGIVLKRISATSNGEEVENQMIFSDEGLEYVDKEGNQLKIEKSGDITIKPNSKFRLFEGNEPMVLGSTLEAELNKLKNKFDTFVSVYSSTIAAVFDSAGATVAKTSIDSAMALEQDADFSKIKSIKSFID